MIIAILFFFNYGVAHWEYGLLLLWLTGIYFITILICKVLTNDLIVLKQVKTHLAKPDQGGGVGGVLWTQSFECMLLAKMKEGILGHFVCETSNREDMVFFTAKRQKLDTWK